MSALLPPRDFASAPTSSAAPGRITIFVGEKNCHEVMGTPYLMSICGSFRGFGLRVVIRFRLTHDNRPQNVHSFLAYFGIVNVLAEGPLVGQ